MARDPLKIILHRAEKVPAIGEFIRNIQNHSIDDVDKLSIKRSDQKLLRDHFDRFKEADRQAILTETLAEKIKDMPSLPPGTENSELFDVYVYNGSGITYNGLEVSPGTVITEGDSWIRFDYYRIKKSENTAALFKDSASVGTMDIYEVNLFIKNKINARHGNQQAAGIRFSRL